MQTIKTSNYSQFKFLERNRKIDPAHVKRLVASITMKNLLEYKPMFVDSKMNVVDGQHRLEAAKEMKIPIFYQVHDDVEDEDMIHLQISKTWLLTDYFNYWITKRAPEYLKMKRIMEAHGMSVKQAILFNEQVNKEKAWQAFKDGDLVMKDEAEVDEMMKKVTMIIDFIKSKNTVGNTKQWVKSQCFTKAIVTLLQNPDVDFGVFLKQLPYKIANLHPCARYVDYYKMLAEVYNYRSRNPIDVEL